MAYVEGKEITATTTGASNHIYLPDKENGQPWTLAITSGTWGDADLQASADGAAWGDWKDAAGSVVNVTANGFAVVPGDMFYRLDVNSYSADIKLLAK